ncbi:MAG: hypothetical protein ACRC92_26195 [Peptostreptococcaceae bacterium]
MAKQLNQKQLKQKQIKSQITRIDKMIDDLISVSVDKYGVPLVFVGMSKVKSFIKLTHIQRINLDSLNKAIVEKDPSIDIRRLEGYRKIYNRFDKKYVNSYEPLVKWLYRGNEDSIKKDRMIVLQSMIGGEDNAE